MKRLLGTFSILILLSTPQIAVADFKVVPFLEELKAISKLEERRARIIHDLPAFLSQQNSGAKSYDERNVPNSDDIRELFRLFVSNDIGTLRLFVSDQDIRAITKTSKEANIGNYFEDEVAAKALRNLTYIYEHPFDSAKIPTELAPLAVAIVDQTLDNRYVSMSGNEFGLLRLMEKLDIWAHPELKYSDRKLEFKVEANKRYPNQPLQIKVRFKPLTRCQKTLLFAKSIAQD